jgi:hypothetical protein
VLFQLSAYSFHPSFMLCALGSFVSEFLKFILHISFVSEHCFLEFGCVCLLCGIDGQHKRNCYRMLAWSLLVVSVRKYQVTFISSLYFSTDYIGLCRHYCLCVSVSLCFYSVSFVNTEIMI